MSAFEIHQNEGLRKLPKVHFKLTELYKTEYKLYCTLLQRTHYKLSGMNINFLLNLHAVYVKKKELHLFFLLFNYISVLLHLI